MTKPKSPDKGGDFWKKIQTEKVIRKSSSTVRRSSVRHLEDFAAVRQHFSQLIMSNPGGDNETSGVTQQGPDTIRAEIVKILADRQKPLRLLRTFSSFTVISRQMLVGVKNKVGLYNQVKDLDARF